MVHVTASNISIAGFLESAIYNRFLDSLVAGTIGGQAAIDFDAGTSGMINLQDGAAFKRVAAQAQQYMDSGQPEALIDTAYPIPLLVTAEVFIEKYGPAEHYDILRHIPHVQVPLLIMVGTAEAQTMMAFQGLPPRLDKLAGEMANLTFASIPGADHAYTHQRDYVWHVVQQWLEKV